MHCGPRARPLALAVPVCCVVAWEVVVHEWEAAMEARWAVAALLALACAHMVAQCGAGKFGQVLHARCIGRGAGSSAVQYCWVHYIRHGMWHGKEMG